MQFDFAVIQFDRGVLSGVLLLFDNRRVQTFSGTRYDGDHERLDQVEGK
jgi:hypothetical protein